MCRILAIVRLRLALSVVRMRGLALSVRLGALRCLAALVRGRGAL